MLGLGDLKYPMLVGVGVSAQNRIIVSSDDGQSMRTKAFFYVGSVV